MKKKLKKIVDKTPIVNNVLGAIDLKLKYKVEANLLKNKDKNHSTKTSIIHFSVNKAATQYVKTLLHKIAIDNDLKPVDFNAYAFKTKHPYLDHLSKVEMNKYKHIFKPKGYVYSVFGGVIYNIDDFNSYDIILSIRDPRDILVSSFYSTAFSHDVPPITSNKREAFIEKRALTKKMGIDQFAIEESNRVYSTFSNYHEMLNRKENNVTVVKYEDMITNHENWLNKLVSNTDIELSLKLKKSFINNYKKTRIKKENKYSHNRKGKSGDFKEKLSPSTIKFLNEKFEMLLKFYGYNI